MPEIKKLQQILGEGEALLELVYRNSGPGHRRFLAFNTVRRNLPVIAVTSALMGGAGIVFAVTGGHLAAGLAIAGCGLLLPFVMLWISYLAARAYIRRNSWYLSSSVTYKFFPEYLYVQSDNGAQRSETVASYESIYRVYETYGNFYIYLTKERVLLVDKKEMTKGELAALYSILGEKVPARRIVMFGKRRKLRPKGV